MCRAGLAVTDGMELLPRNAQSEITTVALHRPVGARYSCVGCRLWAWQKPVRTRAGPRSWGPDPYPSPGPIPGFVHLSMVEYHVQGGLGRHRRHGAASQKCTKRNYDRCFASACWRSLQLCWLQVVGVAEAGPDPSREAALPPTLTPVSVADVVPTFTSTPGHTPTPPSAAPTTGPATDTPVPEPEAIAFRVKGHSNVRSGPGTTYAIVGSQQEGDTVRPVARTRDSQWLELGSGRWIFASLVEGAFGNLPISSNFNAPPIVESAPAATPTPEAAPIQATPRPTPAVDLILAAVSEVQIKIDAEVRSGPDATYDIVVKLQAGDTVQPVAQTDDGQWLELAPGAWIPSSSVEGPVADLPIATPTPVLAPTELPAGTLRVKADAEVRSGPDTTYDIVETLQAGETVQPVTQTSDGQWLELGPGNWISSTSVEGDTDDLPIATTFPPLPTATVIPPTPTGTGSNSPPAFVTWIDGREFQTPIQLNVENRPGFTTIGARDADSVDTEFSFAITGGDDGGLFTLYRVDHSANVIVTFIDNPDHEAPHDKNKDNEYLVQLTVTSGTGERTLSTTKDFFFRLWDEFEPPGPPTILEEQTAITDTTITVFWEHGENPGPPLSSYEIRYETDNVMNWIIGPDLAGSDTEATLEGLKPGTEYGIEVIAFNEEGNSDPPARIEVTTSGNE